MKKSLRILTVAGLMLIGGQSFAGELSAVPEFTKMFSCVSETGLTFDLTLAKTPAAIMASGEVISGSTSIRSLSPTMDRVTVRKKLGRNQLGFFMASMNHTSGVEMDSLKGNIAFRTRLCSPGECSENTFESVSCSSY